MRIKFWMLSALMGCLALLLGLVPGRTQNPSAPPIKRERGARTHLPQKLPTVPVEPAPITVPAPINWADERFRRLDLNGNGLLEVEEMTENLKAERDVWDLNKDGVIDLDEWHAYIKAFTERHARLAAEPKNPAHVSKRTPRAPAPNREPRVQGATRPPFPDWAPRNQRVMWPQPAPGQDPNAPRAVRPPFKERDPRNEARALAKHLPRNIPAWFRAYDTNDDGQVALHEWKAKEDDVREFHKYDLNGDGFITVEELIRSGQFATGQQAPPVLGGMPTEVGDFFYFEVTGAVGGGGWGTDIYTIDSPIATAAVHCGVLEPGQTGLIKVTVLPGQRSYIGSVFNGVTTNAFGPYPKSFRVEKGP